MLSGPPFDFLVIFCSFCIYSLVPGGWHPVFPVWHQCAHALIPHFYSPQRFMLWVISCVSMPSRAYTSFLLKKSTTHSAAEYCVNALSGLYLISTRVRLAVVHSVNKCQCPLGLIPHFYGVSHLIEVLPPLYVNALSGLYLISTQYLSVSSIISMVWCQCPLGLIPHFYRIKGGILIWNFQLVSMPSRAYTSFLRYPFKNLGFMRFPEPVFAGIYQNILTTAVFRAC